VGRATGHCGAAAAERAAVSGLGVGLLERRQRGLHLGDAEEEVSSLMPGLADGVGGDLLRVHEPVERGAGNPRLLHDCLRGDQRALTHKPIVAGSHCPGHLALADSSSMRDFGTMKRRIIGTVGQIVNLKLRFQVLIRDGHTCQYCGAQSPDVVLEVDHVVPRSKGGDDSLGNLMTACRECNQGKRADLLEPLNGPTTWEEAESHIPRWQHESWVRFRGSIMLIKADWLRWVGTPATPAETYAMAELLLRNDYSPLRQAMRISAVRHGYEEEQYNPETWELVTPAVHGRVDFREVRRTLERWRREQNARNGY
jgi:5-methylcytosine-specific restriction endonuclease McrA